MTEKYDFERFTTEELKMIVDAHFAGKTAFEQLENDKESCGLIIYALDSRFCNSALDYLTSIEEKVIPSCA